MSALPPLVSVVIPTYNRAHLIIDALESVKRQTWRPIEIVVVDDGSSDETGTVVSRWADADAGDVAVRYVHQVNAGGNVARNRGIAESRGGLIAFLDSDDLWQPDKLEKQVRILEEHADVVAVYCGVRETVVGRDPGSAAPSPRRYPQGDLEAVLLVQDVTAPTSTYVVRRDAMEAAGRFDTSLRARQDWDMWIRVAQQGRIAAVPAALVDMRHHDGPRTATDPTRELAAYRLILEKYAARRRAYGWRVRAAARAAYHRRAGRVHFHYMHQPVRALGHYLLAILLWPGEPDSYAALLGLLMPQALRERVRRVWNRALGRTRFAIRSH